MAVGPSDRQLCARSCLRPPASAGLECVEAIAPALSDIRNAALAVAERAPRWFSRQKPGSLITALRADAAVRIGLVLDTTRGSTVLMYKAFLDPIAVEPTLA